MAREGADKGKGGRNNVRVVCRVRPESDSEKLRGSSCVRVQHDTVSVHVDEGVHSFTFDQAFGPETTQMQLFEGVALPMVQDVLEGYNATVFAYGQTASGKTFTMEGPDHRHPELKGVIPRAVEALFDGVIQAAETIEFTVKVSYIEIYMERIRDLLDEHNVKTNLQVREDAAGVYVAGVTEAYVTNQDELYGIMELGSRHRAIAATGMNEGSSRSHSVFTVTVGQRNYETNVSKMGKLVLVDLAGSEMVRKTGASGQQLEEAKTINKSLSALGLVINALTDGKSKHVPYRDSKLTRVLQDSLGGNSKTALVIACSPSSFNASESISTLRFGSRAKNIKNSAVVNESRSVEELEGLLAKAQRTIEMQQSSLIALEAQLEQINTDDAARAHADEKASNAIAQLKEAVAELQQELDEEREESTSRQQQVEQLDDLVREKENFLNELSDMLDDAQNRAEQQRTLAERVETEKNQLVQEGEIERSQFIDERNRLNFEVQELQLTIEKLQQEKSRLTTELDEVLAERTRGSMDMESPRQSLGTTTPPKSHDRRASIDFGPLSSIPELIAEETAELARVLETENMDSTASESYRKLCEGLIEKMRQVDEYKATLRRNLQLAQEVLEKRIAELEQQRSRLTRDLEAKVAKVVELERQLAAMQSGSAPSNDQLERERAHHRSVEQRLAQLVAVHRQLLRKFGSLEIENGECRKKIQLRDERIQQLDQQIRSMNANMRMQAERHVQEVAAFKDRLETMKQQFEDEFDDEPVTPLAHLPHHEVRTIRGGGHEVKSIRGGRTMSSRDLLQGMRGRTMSSRDLLSGRRGALEKSSNK